MDRVIPHGQIAQTYPHALAGLGHHRRDRRKHLAVERPQIELGHDGRVRTIGAGVQRPIV